MDKQVTVFLVDDHKLLRDTLRMFLESEKNIQVVGEAGCGEKAVKGILNLQPNLVLMDITLPDFDGIEATIKIISVLPKTKIIAVTMHPEKLYLIKFLEAGGVGYIHKSAADQELLTAIEQVMEGEVFISGDGVQVMAGKFKSQDIFYQDNPKAEVAPDILSDRERQVLALFARGYNCREIGERLYLAASTVETYKKRATEKLNLTKKPDLVKYAIRHRLFEEV
ncbi:MAG: response regulator transcription factor [Bacillota bacterium]